MALAGPLRTGSPRSGRVRKARETIRGRRSSSDDGSRDFWDSIYGFSAAELLDKNKSAPAAFDKIVSSGQKPSRLRGTLISALLDCWFAYRLAGSSKGDRLGKGRLSYYKFPKRVRDFAAEIERVNESWLGSPVRRLVARIDSILRDYGRRYGHLPRAEHANLVKEYLSLYESGRRLEQLPVLLREYADALKPAPRDGKGSEHKNLESDQEILLMDLVETETGKPHLSEVSLLLQAVYSLAGGSKERSLEGKALSERRRRYRQSGKAPISLDPEGGTAELEFRLFLAQRKGRAAELQFRESLDAIVQNVCDFLAERAPRKRGK